MTREQQTLVAEFRGVFGDKCFDTTSVILKARECPETRNSDRGCGTKLPISANGVALRRRRKVKSLTLELIKQLVDANR